MGIDFRDFDQGVVDFDAKPSGTTSTPNHPTGPELRDAALHQVETNASEQFKDLAYLALVDAARAKSRLTVDDVWDRLGRSIQTNDNRAMGAVMMRGKRDKVIQPTADFRPSTQPQCHANPRRVWLSSIVEGE